MSTLPAVIRAATSASSPPNGIGTAATPPPTVSVPLTVRRPFWTCTIVDRGAGGLGNLHRVRGDRAGVDGEQADLDDVGGKRRAVLADRQRGIRADGDRAADVYRRACRSDSPTGQLQRPGNVDHCAGVHRRCRCADHETAGHLHGCAA